MSEKNFAVQGSIEINGVNIDLSNTQVGSSLHRIGNQFTAKQETPIGTVVMYTGLINGTKTNLPTGWLLCDGSETAVATYPELDAVVGTRYGNRTNGSGGAGSSHFRLPNLVNRIPIGQQWVSSTSTNTVESTSDTTTLSSHQHTSGHNSNAHDGFSTHGHNTTAGNSSHSHGTSSANKSNAGHALGGAGAHSHSYKYGQIAANMTFTDTGHTHNSNTDNAGHSHNGSNGNGNSHQHNSNSAGLDHSHTVTVSTSDANQTMNNSAHQHSAGFSVVKVFFLIKAKNEV